MCFSPEADFVSGAAIGVVGVATLAKVENRRELALGVVPLALALHQIVEGFVWLGLDDKVANSSSDVSVHVYVAFAWVVLPILLPGMIAVALFGFTLSYDEFPRTSIAVGASNTLPLEIWNMTTNVTSPALFAIGTVTTALSFVVIALALGSIALIQRRRTRRIVREAGRAA